MGRQANLLLFLQKLTLGDGWEDPEVHKDPEEVRIKKPKKWVQILFNSFLANKPFIYAVIFIGSSAIKNISNRTSNNFFLIAGLLAPSSPKKMALGSSAEVVNRTQRRHHRHDRSGTENRTDRQVNPAGDDDEGHPGRQYRVDRGLTHDVHDVGFRPAKFGVIRLKPIKSGSEQVRSLPTGSRCAA